LIRAVTSYTTVQSPYLQGLRLLSAGDGSQGAARTAGH
jgi:hypothetical protein